MKKFILSLLVVVVNSVMAIYIVSHKTPGISQYLLVILMANMMLYVAYYCGMKLRYRYLHKLVTLYIPSSEVAVVLMRRFNSIRHSPKYKNEAINVISMCYFLLSAIFMLIGFIFFTIESKNKHMTPAQSRSGLRIDMLNNISTSKYWTSFLIIWYVPT